MQDLDTDEFDESEELVEQEIFKLSVEQCELEELAVIFCGELC